MTPILTAEQIEDFLGREFPQIMAGGHAFKCVNIAPGTATLRFWPTEAHIRPGGTVSGPAIFTLADVAAYVALLAHIGPVALALTTNLNINFLNRADPVPLDGVCHILKLGRTLDVPDREVGALTRLDRAGLGREPERPRRLPRDAGEALADFTAAVLMNSWTPAVPVAAIDGLGFRGDERFVTLLRDAYATQSPEPV